MEQAIFFYFFSFLTLLTALASVTSKNTVNSVLWLIFTFCNAAGLIILLGAEFIGLIIIIIYVGAVAVLFLFVVMMINLNIIDSQDNQDQKNNSITNKYLNKIKIFVIALLFAINIILIILSSKNNLFVDSLNHNTEFYIENNNISSVYQIGEILYTQFFLNFQIAGLILFAAMIASIALIMQKKNNAKKQDVFKQLKRNRDNSIYTTDNDSVKGVKNIKYED